MSQQVLHSSRFLGVITQKVTDHNLAMDPFSVLENAGFQHFVPSLIFGVIASTFLIIRQATGSTVILTLIPEQPLLSGFLLVHATKVSKKVLQSQRFLRVVTNRVVPNATVRPFFILQNARPYPRLVKVLLAHSIIIEDVHIWECISQLCHQI
uniref:(northern house mosquito) hypothetical protein n=1 Tax=Culex pipiens TaxID=7175 RepID=A0A8D8I131_CULPI